jgi:hypothetical protein
LYFLCHPFFGVINDCGENDDGHGQWEDQKAQFGGTRLEGVAQYSQTLGMSEKNWKLKNNIRLKWNIQFSRKYL